MKKQTRVSSATLATTAMLLVACGGGGDGGAPPAATPTAEEQARSAAISLVAGQYALVCQGPGSADGQLSLSIGADGEIRLGNRPALQATDRDATVLISYVATNGQASPRALNVVVSQARGEANGRLTNLSVNFGSALDGTFVLVDVQYDRADQTDWARCVPAEVRHGPRQPIQSLMPPLIGRASASVMCTAGGTNIAARYQLELTDAALTISSSTSSLRVDLVQGRTVEEVRYPSQYDAVTPANTGQVHQAQLDDGSWFSIIRDRSGTLTEASAGSVRPGAASLHCRT